MLFTDLAQEGVFPIRWPAYLASAAPGGVPPPFEVVARRIETPVGRKEPPRTPAGQAQGPTIVYLRDRMAEVLGLPASAMGDEDALLDLGLDSLGALLLANRIRADLGIGVSMAAIVDAPNLMTPADSVDAASGKQTTRPITGRRLR